MRLPPFRKTKRAASALPVHYLRIGGCHAPAGRGDRHVGPPQGANQFRRRRVETAEDPGDRGGAADPGDGHAAAGRYDAEKPDLENAIHGVRRRRGGPAAAKGRMRSNSRDPHHQRTGRRRQDHLGHPTGHEPGPRPAEDRAGGLRFAAAHARRSPGTSAGTGNLRGPPRSRRYHGHGPANRNRVPLRGHGRILESPGAGGSEQRRRCHGAGATPA